jgi:hypothetical protein
MPSFIIVRPEYTATYTPLGDGFVRVTNDYNQPGFAPFTDTFRLETARKSWKYNLDHGGKRVA